MLSKIQARVEEIDVRCVFSVIDNSAVDKMQK